MTDCLKRFGQRRHIGSNIHLIGEPIHEPRLPLWRWEDGLPTFALSNLSGARSEQNYRMQLRRDNPPRPQTEYHGL